MTTAVLETPVSEDTDIEIIPVSVGISPDDNETEIAAIGAAIVKTIDYAGKLAEYCSIGARTVKLGRKQIKSIGAGEYGKDDFKRLCDRIADAARLSSPITDIRVNVYVKMHLWVDAVNKLMTTDDKPKSVVSGLSYYVVANKLLPTLEFDVATLTGEIKEAWIPFVRETVSALMSDTPPSTKSIDAGIKARDSQIKAARQAKMDPDKVIALEQAEATRIANAPRKAAHTKIQTAIQTGIEEGLATPAEVVTLFKSALSMLALPNDVLNPTVPTVVAHAATMSPDDGVVLVKALFGLKRHNQMHAMKVELDRLFKELLEASRKLAVEATANAA